MAQVQSNNPFVDFETPYAAGIRGRLAMGAFRSLVEGLAFFLADFCADDFRDIRQLKRRTAGRSSALPLPLCANHIAAAERPTSQSGLALLVSVRLLVMFGSFLSVVGRLEMVSMSGVGMVRGFLVIAGLMVFRSLPVVIGRVIMMVSGLIVVVRSFLRHSEFLSLERFRLMEVESRRDFQADTCRARLSGVNY